MRRIILKLGIEMGDKNNWTPQVAPNMKMGERNNSWNQSIGLDEWIGFRSRRTIMIKISNNTENEATKKTCDGAIGNLLGKNSYFCWFRYCIAWPVLSGVEATLRRCNFEPIMVEMSRFSIQIFGAEDFDRGWCDAHSSSAVFPHIFWFVLLASSRVWRKTRVRSRDINHIQGLKCLFPLFPTHPLSLHKKRPFSYVFVQCCMGWGGALKKSRLIWLWMLD